MSTLPAASSPFVPTLDRARAAGLPLPLDPPIAEERWSALVVIATILRRRSWKEEIFRHPDSVAHIPRKPPVEPDMLGPGTHVAVEDIGDLGRCPDCADTPGLRKCRVCGGTGALRVGRGAYPCSCGGTGRVACPTCLRQGTTHRIVLRYYEDEPRWMKEFYVPSHLPCHAPLFGLEGAMEQTANIIAEAPPEDLRCHDLTGRAAGSAYRGGERLVRPTFYGHDFGDTIERAMTAIAALSAGGKALRYDIRAYAWPLLRLQFAGQTPDRPDEVVVYPDRHGGLRIFQGEAR